jgi:cyanophycinase
MSFLLRLSLAGMLTVCGANAQRAYQDYILGNAGDVQTTTAAGTVLMGGGQDVAEAFRWMIQKSGGGDFVVIRASGDDAYNPYIYALGNSDSVETIVFRTKDASSDPYVLDRIRTAEALFMAGGDQSDYLRLWKDTPVEAAINDLISRRVPVGGTSAGLAVLGQFIYTGARGSVESSQALANPYDFRVTLDRNFLNVPQLAQTITDSHFTQRDRLGRLVTFLARLIQDQWSMKPRGIGIDEHTALLMESNGAVTLVGSGQSWFLLPTSIPDVCQPRKPLTFRGIQLYRIDKKGTFNLISWTGTGGISESVDVVSGLISTH